MAAARFFSIVALGGALAGCAYSTPSTWIPPNVPGYASVDVDASEVVVEDPEEDLDADSAIQVRRELAEMLTEARRGSGAGSPARFRAKVELKTQGLIWLTEGPQIIYSPFLLVFVPFGETLWHASATLEVSLEVGTTTYRGTGSGEAGGSIYAAASRRALALALQEALSGSGATAAARVRLP